jgi:predicted RNase H-like nuclease
LQDPGVTGVLGVDGCRGGWVSALVEGRRVSWHRFATFAEAGRLHRELTGGLGLSLQTWHLVPKIREVDAVADDPRLVEVHPELSLAALGGSGPLPSKKTAAGRAARVALLTGWLGELGDLPAGDDGLDALAVAWSAHRWLAGRARTLPGVPAFDETGRPMRIVT